MFVDFNDFTSTVKPELDDALRKQLWSLTNGIPLSDATSFEAAIAGGKMIRGCLLCLIAKSLGGTAEAAFPHAIAIELIQAASLLHDDFVDQDTIRRNKPATWTLEGARRTVLLGDFIFASAIKMMNTLGWEEGSIIANAIVQLSRGAIQEPVNFHLLSREIELNRFDRSIYEKIIYLKTGNLFGAACRLGSIAAKADKWLKERSERYGLHIGEAYQIADDLEDIEKHLKAGSIDPNQLAFLTPACLYFAKDIGHHLLTFFRADSPVLPCSLIEYFEIVADRMKDEIERRLELAVAEIDTYFPQNEFGYLALLAPRDLIRMFNCDVKEFRSIVWPASTDEARGLPH